MKICVLTFAGPIAGGKTTLAQNLANALEWPYTSFGDYVRGEARRRKLNHESREILQELGSNLIEGGWDSFCSSVISVANWNTKTGLIIDGVRHVECLETIKKLVKPIITYLIYVDIEKGTREARLAGKALDSETITQIENHQTEIQVSTKLKTIADLVVDGAALFEENVDIIINWLSRTGEGN